MTLEERVLYHQVHPLKLAADIGATIVAIPVLWNGELLLGLAIAFGMPVIGSTLVLWRADLTRIAEGPLGEYLDRFMPPTVQLIRLAGGVAILVGAWEHSVAIILIAVAIVALAWANGLPRRRAV